MPQHRTRRDGHANGPTTRGPAGTSASATTTAGGLAAAPPAAYVVTDWLDAKPGCEEALERALVPAIRAEREAALQRGATAFELHRSADTPGRFLLYERWADETAFTAFHAGPRPDVFLAFLAVADDLLARPVREVAAFWTPVPLTAA